MLNALRQLRRNSLACLAFLMPLAAASALADDGLRAIAKYTVTLGGTQIAVANVTLSDADGRYDLALDAKVSGLAQLVANGSAHLESIGRSTAKSLIAETFDLSTKASGDIFSVAITYAGGGVASFKVDPPIVNNIDRVAIERKHLVSANDMAAPFIVKGGQLDRSICDRKLQIFTGIERFDLSLRYAKDDVATSKRTGYQGPVVLCSVHYTPISGHYTTSEVTKYLSENERILIWYAPLKDTGYFIPYRALVNTDAGDLSIVLTDIEN